jgi:hypothetical protein
MNSQMQVSDDKLLSNIFPRQRSAAPSKIEETSDIEFNPLTAPK